MIYLSICGGNLKPSITHIPDVLTPFQCVRLSFLGIRPEHEELATSLDLWPILMGIWSRSLTSTPTAINMCITSFSVVFTSLGTSARISLVVWFTASAGVDKYMLVIFVAVAARVGDFFSCSEWFARRPNCPAWPFQ